MYVYRLYLTPKTTEQNTDEENTREVIWNYLSCLYKNGQISENYELIRQEEGLIAYVTLPEEDALDPVHNNIYVNKYLEQLKTLYGMKLKFLGHNLDLDPPCKCQSPSWYMLYTDWSLSESPIVCGDCGSTVPLYKLPHIMDEKEHYSTLGWQRAYIDTDSLFLHSLTDRFTYRQLHDPNSALSLEGREICKEFEKKLGTPFYYYIFNYYRSQKTCPICGHSWDASEEGTFIDYRCERCRLVADKTNYDK